MKCYPMRPSKSSIAERVFVAMVDHGCDSYCKNAWYDHATDEPANLPKSYNPGVLVTVSFVSERTNSQWLVPDDN